MNDNKQKTKIATSKKKNQKKTQKRLPKILLILTAIIGALITLTAIVLFIIILANGAIRESFFLSIEHKTKTTLIENEEIQYGTKEEDDNTIYVGETRISQRGKKGTKQIKYYIISDSDNNEIQREKISEEIIEKPTIEIVKKGTKKQEVITQKCTCNCPQNSSSSNTTKQNSATTKKTFTDDQLIYICDTAIRKKTGWALSKGDAGSDDRGPSVTRGTNAYTVRGWRRTGAYSFVRGGCFIDGNGTVTSVF